jgi:hypothetical protein
MDVLGFDKLKEMYKDDAYFKDAYASYDNLASRDRRPWLECMIQ